MRKTVLTRDGQYKNWKIEDKWNRKVFDAVHELKDLALSLYNEGASLSDIHYILFKALSSSLENLRFHIKEAKRIKERNRKRKYRRIR